jgi:hypothetical protein
MRTGTFRHKFVTGLVAIAAVVVAAVAIARSSSDAETNSFANAQPTAAICPKIAWPYGCEWRPAAEPGTKRLSARKNSKHSRLHMRFLARAVSAAPAFNRETDADWGR